MRREDLLYSIGNIDEKFISEADRPYMGLMPKIMKYGSIAASLVLVLTVSFFLIFQVLVGVNGEDGAGGDFSGDSGYADGADGSTGNASGGSGSTTGKPESDVLYAEGGTLTVIAEDGNSVVLLLEIVGEISSPELRVILSRGGERFVLTTEDNYVGSESPLGLPKFTVDGVECTELPTEVGEYEIALDLASTLDGGCEIEGIWILPFGKIDVSD